QKITSSLPPCLRLFICLFVSRVINFSPKLESAIVALSVRSVTFFNYFSFFVRYPPTLLEALSCVTSLLLPPICLHAAVTSRCQHTQICRAAAKRALLIATSSAPDTQQH
ncbi:Hypothetical protein, putative, partial [Bodo saltans]